MTSDNLFIALFLLVSAQAMLSQAGRCLLNTLNTTTGDFGGLEATAGRDQFETFIDVDSYGNVVSYGFFMPFLENLGVSGMGEPIGIALDFNQRFNLSKPEQMPYHFVGITIRPKTRMTPAYLETHLWLSPKELALGIECEGTSSGTCVASEYLAERFSRTANHDFYPGGYSNRPENWVPGIGARLLPDLLPGSSEPLNMFGSFNGDLTFHASRLSADVIKVVSPSSPRTFLWPSTRRFPKQGRFFTQYQITQVQGRYRFEFRGLEEAPRSVNSVVVYTGDQFLPFLLRFENVISSGKDCLINSGKTIDAGWTVVSREGTFCCRARGDFNSGVCTRNTCFGTADLASPPDAYFSSLSGGYCYAKCFKQTS